MAGIFDTGWTPNKITLLRVAVGFAAVSLFGRGTWANLFAVALTVAAIALDALDGHLARKKQMATPLGAQLDVLGDRIPVHGLHRERLQDEHVKRALEQFLFLVTRHASSAPEDMQNSYPS